VLLQNLFGTETMGLLFVGIHEICSLWHRQKLEF
jgi:hypothetical protein